MRTDQHPCHQRRTNGGESLPAQAGADLADQNCSAIGQLTQTLTKGQSGANPELIAEIGNLLQRHALQIRSDERFRW